VALLKTGQYRETACHAAGVSVRVLRDWVTRGEEGDERWSEFAQRVREAESDCEINAVTQILSVDDWRARTWWLERRFPTRWGDAKAASARVEAERETILDALLRSLTNRGLGNAAEEILRDIAGLGADETSNSVAESRQSH
jgi:hypothetical protein